MRPHFLREDELRDIIRGFLSQKGFRVKGLAAHLGLEVRTLGRRFDEHFRTTPKRWMVRERMNLAPQLLADGFSNKEVASSLNFTRESSFCRAFKRHFGCPPQAFARSQKDSPDVSHLANELSRPAKPVELLRASVRRML